MATITAQTMRPVLSAAQRDRVLATAARMVAATAAECPAEVIGDDLDGTADLPLAGVFVSLKRGSHLRACTGGLRQHSVPLAQALADAVESTVLRDHRFPAVSPGELTHLRLEIWLLFNPQRVTARGEDRVHAVVTGGKHGVIVTRGENHGLLLPGVAADHGWDSRTLLEQVCVKAGIHPSLWKDDGTSLRTFEGDVLRGNLGDWIAPQHAPDFTDRSELEGYFEFCWENIVTTIQGATPRYFHPGLRDLFIHGATLTLRPPGGSEAIHLTNLSLRPGMRSQNALVQLAQTGSQHLARRGVHYGLLNRVGMSLTLYGDPHLHGTVAEPDLNGIETERRCVLVTERNKHGIVFRPGAGAHDLLAEAAREAQVQRPEAAQVFSLQAFSTDRALAISTAPQPRRGPAERHPGVAGSFYPAEPEALAPLVDELLARGKSTIPPRRLPAAMVPHAGLRYSGHIAARVLQRLEFPERIIVLGPKHTALGMDWAVAPHQTWVIPGAQIASDFMLARQLSQAIPGLALDAAAHQREHAIEVELPFLARLAPKSRVVGIALGHGDWADAERFAAGLAYVIRHMPEPPLLLISSDMNHFATDDETRKLDDLALSALEALDPQAALQTIRERGISMCGVLPAVIVLETLRQLGRLNRTERCGYATSAEVTGDPQRVVGYAGMLFE